MSTDDSGVHRERNWRDLAAQASEETDPAKMLKIIAELCDALDHRTAPQQAKPVNKKSDIIPADD